MLRVKKIQAGMTLIELAIGLVIIGLLFSLALPSYRQWIQNSQIRATAEAIQNGLQLARSEAVRRNTRVEFVLTAASPVVANVGAAANAAGPNWIVRVFQAAGVYTANDFIQGRAGAEGSLNAAITPNGGQSSFVFTALGGLTPLPGATIPIDITSNSSAANRPLRILISTGGTIRMCDPHLVLANNPQGC